MSPRPRRFSPKWGPLVWVRVWLERHRVLAPGGRERLLEAVFETPVHRVHRFRFHLEVPWVERIRAEGRGEDDGYVRVLVECEAEGGGRPQSADELRVVAD